MREWGGFMFMDAKEMAEVDREAIEAFGIPAELLMENAGAAVASVARSILGGTWGKRVEVLAGKGNNGGDGLVAARRLSNLGADVEVRLGCGKGELRELPALQAGILERMGLKVSEPGTPRGRADLIVDSLLGYGAKGDPAGEVAELIAAANSSGAPILAVDIPSGLDATTGDVHTPCIRARATVTFGYPKTGFLEPKAREFLGELILADISLPPGKASGGGRSAFDVESLVRVW